MGIHGAGYRGFRSGRVNGIGFKLDGFAGRQYGPVESQNKAFLVALERAHQTSVAVGAGRDRRQHSGRDIRVHSHIYDGIKQIARLERHGGRRRVP